MNDSRLLYTHILIKRTCTPEIIYSRLNQSFRYPDHDKRLYYFEGRILLYFPNVLLFLTRNYTRRVLQNLYDFFLLI